MAPTLLDGALVLQGRLQGGVGRQVNSGQGDRQSTSETKEH